MKFPSSKSITGKDAKTKAVDAFKNKTVKISGIEKDGRLLTT